MKEDPQDHHKPGGWQAIKPSTRAFNREARQTPGYGLFSWLHGQVYGRWTYLYIGIGVGDHPLARRLAPVLRVYQRIARRLSRQPPGSPPPASRDKGVAAEYHGKVLPLQAATELVSVQEEIRLKDLEKVIPYPRARDIILKNPDHIVALDCPCRSARENPCLPLDVCLIVGEPFASFVLEHHPRSTRQISQAEAAAILKAEHERGHVHHAFFKEAMLGRFYAICNCCSCCCGAIHAHAHGTPMLASSGYLAEVDEDLCIACGDCQDSCQFGALSLQEFTSAVDSQACMGCGVCVDQCQQGALSLARATHKGEPLEILELIKSVDG